MRIETGEQLWVDFVHPYLSSLRYKVGHGSWRIRQRGNTSKWPCLFSSSYERSSEVVLWLQFGVCGIHTQNQSEESLYPQLNDYFVSLTVQHLPSNPDNNYHEGIWYYTPLYWSRSCQEVIQWVKDKFGIEVYRKWFHEKGEIYY